MPGPGEGPAVVAPAAWRPLGGCGSRRPTRGCEDAAGEKMEPSTWEARGQRQEGLRPRVTVLPAGGLLGQAWGAAPGRGARWPRKGPGPGPAGLGVRLPGPPARSPQGARSPHQVRPRPPPRVGSGTGEVPLRPSRWPSDAKSPGCSRARNRGRQARSGPPSIRAPRGQVQGHDGNSPEEGRSLQVTGRSPEGTGKGKWAR